MLHVSNSGTPLPPRPANISVEKLYIKEATGFALWNGRRGSAARVYLIPMERAGHPDGVIRFLGGTAVPFPYSTVSPALQSLIRVQAHFEDEVALTEEVAEDYIPLHTTMAQKVRFYANPANLGSAAISQTAQMDNGIPSHEAPNVEIHGLLPTSEMFLSRFAHKLERVWLDDAGKVKTASGRPFNNVGIIHVMRHLLAQVQGTGEMAIRTHVNPAWDNGDDTVCNDD